MPRLPCRVRPLAGVRTRVLPLALAIAMLGSTPRLYAAEELAPFALTSYEGYVSASLVSDEFVTRQAGATGSTPTSTQKQSDLRVEAFLMTHSYVYHPKFMALDIGGGPILESGLAENDAVSTRSQRPLYNLTARATVLADKPYNGSVYYEHLNPTLLLSPGEIFTQQTERYGLTFALLEPVTPIPFSLDASRSHAMGESTLRVVDDRIDDVSLRAEYALSTFGRIQLAYHDLQQDSNSGSPNLPIQNSQLHSRSLSADTHVQFGDKREHDIFNTILLTSQDYTLEQGRTPRLDSARFLLNYRGVHSPELHSFASYNFGRNEQDADVTDVNTASASLTWYPSRNLTLAAGLHGEDTQAPQFAVRSWGVDGSVRYEQALPLGSLQASYALRYDQRQQTATVTQPTVVGEHVVLSSTVPVALARSNVTSGSVVVSDLARTQVFIEGIDYLLTVVGVTTRIERVLSGNILDGQELLVDYAFDAGGTYESAPLDQNIALNWAVSRYMNVYLRYAESLPRVTSGTPATPLNTIHDTLVGVRGDSPPQLPINVLIGGSLEREDRRETIAPFARTAAELYVNGDLPFEDRVDLRVAARRTRVTADNVLQNVDLKAYDMWLGWRHSSGLRITANALYERDTGAVEVRERRSGILRALWRFRQLTLTGDLSRTRETQGSYVRERTAGKLILRREF